MVPGTSSLATGRGDGIENQRSLRSSITRLDHRTKAHLAFGDAFVRFGDLIQRSPTADALPWTIKQLTLL